MLRRALIRLKIAVYNSTGEVLGGQGTENYRIAERYEAKKLSC